MTRSLLGLSVCLALIACTASAQPARTVTLSGTVHAQLSRVRFASASAALAADASVLDEVASALAQHADITLLRVVGHADNTEANAAGLSLARANAVRDALVARGVAPSRLIAEGRAAERPADSNATDEGRAMNRRVELEVAERAP